MKSLKDMSGKGKGGEKKYGKLEEVVEEIERIIREMGRVFEGSYGDVNYGEGRMK